MMELMERLILRHRKLEPTGSKRKLPKPTTCPMLSWLKSNRREMTERYQASVRDTEEALESLQQ